MGSVSQYPSKLSQYPDETKKIYEVVGVVDKSIEDSDVQEGSFLRVYATMNVSLPLCCDRIISLEEGTKTWVSFKYEWLPNICYWCGV